MDRRVTRALCVVALVGTLGLVVATALDPESGTSSNFQAADDVPSLIVGAHHAKPVPASGASVIGAVLLLVAGALLAGQRWLPVASTRLRVEETRAKAPRSLATRGAHTWRAPPVPFSA